MYNIMKTPNLVRSAMSTIVVGTVLLPILGFSFAVIWSVLFDWENSTATHCGVVNYLPSVSAAIAFTPQAYVWRACIALHITPRFMYAFAYWNWYRQLPVIRSSMLSSLQGVWIFLSVASHVVELSALLGLTCVSSRENGGVHELMFILFMVGSLTCMTCSLILTTTTVFETLQQKRGTRYKRWAYTVNVTAFISCMYFYFRHNKHCEPGMYTLFALCEYIVILSNVAFHYTIALDLDGFHIVLNNTEEEKLS